MSRITRKIILTSIIFFTAFPFFTYAASSTINLELGISYCNINGICEPHLGENVFTCPSECIAPSATSIPVFGFFPANNTVFFRNVLVTTFADRVIITWQSSLPTIDTVTWGKTVDFNDGSLRGLVYTKNHRIEISDLTPDTFYYARIVSEDGSRRVVDYGVVPFVTLPSPGTISNPTYVRAESIPEGIFLSWINPAIEDFSYTRILKNDFAYPKDPFSGTLIFEGQGQSFLDKNVNTNEKNFYALFSRSKNGNFSSGVFVSAVHGAKSIDRPSTETPGKVIDDDEKEQATSKIRRYIFRETGEIVLPAIKTLWETLYLWLVFIWNIILNICKVIYNLIISLF